MREVPLWPAASASQGCFAKGAIRGYLAHKNPPPPQGRHKVLGMVLL